MITAATFQASEQLGVSTYRVRIRLTDDVTGIADEWFTVTGSTLNELRDDVSRQIAARNALLSMKSILAGIAVGTVIPVTAPAPAVVPQAELDKRAYFASVERLIHMQQLVAAGGMLANNAEFTALQTSVKNAYLASYATSF